MKEAAQRPFIWIIILNRNDYVTNVRNILSLLYKACYSRLFYKQRFWKDWVGSGKKHTYLQRKTSASEMCGIATKTSPIPEQIILLESIDISIKTLWTKVSFLKKEIIWIF